MAGPCFLVEQVGTLNIVNVATPTQLIVHESERQRQYSRLTSPLSIKVAGQRYDIIDWSVGGFCMSTETVSLTPGNTYAGRIVLPFDDFGIEVKISFQVCYRDESIQRMGCRLIEQTPTQLALLQFMVRAHLTGEIVQINDIMNVMQRGDAFTARELPKPSAKEQTKHRTRHLVIRGALSLVLVAMFALIVTSVYERVFVIQANSAVVTTDLVQIAAPQGGRVAFGPDVSEGTSSPGGLLATITSPGGSTYYIESPCDCVIVDRLTSDDSQVGVGVNLFLLAPIEAELRVSALVAYEDALRLREGMPVNLSFPAGEGQTIGTIRKIDMRRQLSELGQPLMDPEAVISAELVIETAEPLPLQWVGRPVAVTLDTFALTWLGDVFLGDAS